MTYGAIAGLCVGCGVLRGGLRYLEQYGNHYIAFRLLAVLRDKIFTKLRALCPAKLESRQKGSLLTMITADIETLEVFYAHTVSPVCIAVLVSLAVMVVTGLAASWYLSLIAAAAYLCIGILLPRFSPAAWPRPACGTGGSWRLRRVFSRQHQGHTGAGPLQRRRGPSRRSRSPLRRHAGQDEGPQAGNGPLSAAATEAPCRYRCWQCWLWGYSSFMAAASAWGRMVLGVTAVFGSSAVIAVSALPANLNQTFASGGASFACWRSSRR